MAFERRKYEFQKKRADNLAKRVESLSNENKRLHIELDSYENVIDSAKKAEQEYRKLIEQTNEIKQKYESAIREAKLLTAKKRFEFNLFLRKLKKT